MVLAMKNEMNLIHIVQQKSNIDEYAEEILDIFGHQENKINSMKQKFQDLKDYLKKKMN